VAWSLKIPNQATNMEAACHLILWKVQDKGCIKHTKNMWADTKWICCPKQSGILEL